MREISNRAYELTKDFRDREQQLNRAQNVVTEPFYSRIRALNTEIDASPEPEDTQKESALLEHRNSLLAPIKAQQEPLNARSQQAMLAAEAKLDVFRAKLVELAKSDERAARHTK